MGHPAVSGVGRDVSSLAASAAVPALLVLAVLAVPAAFVAARRRGQHSMSAWFVGFVTIALILSVTLFRGEVGLGFDVGRLSSWSRGGSSSLSRDPLGSSQFVLNVALFVPAGAAWTWLTRRAVPTVVALIAGSFLIECLQALTGAGANDLVDLAANSLGAVIGSATALVVRVATGRDQQRSRKRTALVVGSLAVAVLLGTAGVFVGASRRQTHVRSIVEERFGDVDLAQIRDLVDTDLEAVLGIVDGARADGVMSGERVELRYPATFFSLRRCIYVTWTATTMEIRDASGGDCSRLLQ